MWESTRPDLCHKVALGKLFHKKVNYTNRQQEHLASPGFNVSSMRIVALGSYTGHGFVVSDSGVKCIHQNRIFPLLFLQNQKPSCQSKRDNLYIRYQAGVGCIRGKNLCPLPLRVLASVLLCSCTFL